MTQQPSCLTFLDETGFRCGCQVINPCPTYVTCGCLRPNQIQSCLAAVATCMQNCPTQYPSCGMSRSRFVTPCCCMLLVAAVLALADAFVVPSSPHASSARSHINKIDRAEPMISSDACAVFMSVLAGLIVGVALPASSLAGTGGARPDVQVVRPGLMQGIDGASAATKPGEIDHVTRSRSEASYFPQVLEELKQEKAKLEAAPSKHERLIQDMQQMREYAKLAVFHTSEVALGHRLIDHEDVQIRFPAAASSRPQVSSAEPGEASYDGQSEVCWRIPVLDKSEPNGNLEFVAKTDSASLLPFTFDAVRRGATKCPMDIIECYHMEKKDAIAFACEKAALARFLSRGPEGCARLVSSLRHEVDSRASATV
ncbi:unnamed protein product [Symbiodinium microadriaticum]|nr:unnamed protein product [Symbiodinium microadriaticum]